MGNGVMLTETEVATSALDSIIEVIPKLFELSNECFTSIVENEFLLIFLAVGFIAIGFRIFRMGKRTAKG
ncbi:MAG: hypothetical protein IJZ96_00720 [Lachnospiraceae bacterium]|nr:hypothetical protein [Lachnospiraceae bacterium]